jgi:hypothetical protein
MGTGIVSIGLLLDGRETLSRVLLAVATVAWLDRFPRGDVRRLQL